MRYYAPLALLLAAPVAAQDRPVLEVYTYDSFVTEWGPGPAIEEAFEATCACDLRFTAAGDGAALLSRLKLEGARTDADVVVGLDSNLMQEAGETGLFGASGLADVNWDLPIAWEDDTFVPFDWGYFAFVHRADFDAPTDFRALAESDTSILIQDPRSSTPGLGLLLWVKTAYGEEAEAIWDGLADNIVTVTPGWSEAYNLFLEGEADMVLSYTTSPAYHLIAEEDEGFTAAAFDEGHYLQVEVAAAVASSDQTELAQDFLAFLSSGEAQSILPTTNWMYPAKTPEGGLPAGFDTLIAPEVALLVPASETPETTDAALAEWLTALGR
ncbi:Thiamine-binding periplasmic protein precursor [Rhodobacteraceae bacterium THAF1]|uniref:thiamine ABC transporter substrate binding subunit n=1 Tax=Palleronia sp. THAF1 TaxID=2587842 RepID=UPI000F4084EA|nr:thiamine ABC transporter substrate binding subunit [Palleronia sp. THAF1]QFU07253.1 Thiamine-binding periplasmic protein precursor [Palleronia sp. THAF1]VDC20835.1 Thiamine-binding periplasmic protein precursor [Rhodobacteraceae bacterium THAF1]